MKQTLQSLMIGAVSLIALDSCKSEASETTTETVTTTTTTYEGLAGGEGNSGSGGGVAANTATGANEGSDTRTVYINERSKNKDARKKKVVVRSAYTPGNFPESSERILTEKDITHLSPWGKKLMRNEIYARHGQTFTDPALKEHFAKQSWYDGKHKNVTASLTSIERQNLELLNDQ